MKGECINTGLSLDIRFSFDWVCSCCDESLTPNILVFPPGVFFLNVFPALVSVGNPGASCGSPRHITRYPSIDSRAGNSTVEGESESVAVRRCSTRR